MSSTRQPVHMFLRWSEMLLLCRPISTPPSSGLPSKTVRASSAAEAEESSRSSEFPSGHLLVDGLGRELHPDEKEASLPGGELLGNVDALIAVDAQRWLSTENRIPTHLQSSDQTPETDSTQLSAKNVHHGKRIGNLIPTTHSHFSFSPF